MIQNDFENFCDLIDVVAEQYGKTMSENLKMLYWQGLIDLDYSGVRDALFRHIKNTDRDGTFMPKIADIRRMIEGSSEDSALIAWAKVDKAVRSIGTYETVVFDDPLIHAALHEMGGWLMLETKTEDEWPFVQREFVNRYRNYKSKRMQPDYPCKLIGKAEAYNTEKGFEIEKPILAGDQERAQQVMLKGSYSYSFGSGFDIKRLSNHVDSLNLVESK